MKVNSFSFFRVIFISFLMIFFTLNTSFASVGCNFKFETCSKEKESSFLNLNNEVTRIKDADIKSFSPTVFFNDCSINTRKKFAKYFSCMALLGKFLQLQNEIAEEKRFDLNKNDSICKEINVNKCNCSNEEKINLNKYCKKEIGSFIYNKKDSYCDTCKSKNDIISNLESCFSIIENDPSINECGRRLYSVGNSRAIQINNIVNEKNTILNDLNKNSCGYSHNTNGIDIFSKDLSNLNREKIDKENESNSKDKTEKRQRLKECFGYIGDKNGTPLEPWSLGETERKALKSIDGVNNECRVILNNKTQTLSLTCNGERNMTCDKVKMCTNQNIKEGDSCEGKKPGSYAECQPSELKLCVNRVKKSI